MSEFRERVWSAGFGVFQLARWWLLDVCQVLLILAIIEVANRHMATDNHLLTWITRVTAVIYIGGSFTLTYRALELRAGWSGRLRVGRWQVPVSSLVAPMALAATVAALTTFLDPIVATFGAML